MKYSLIIPVYNRPQEIQELLQSLTKQTFSGLWEVIIVEDGSKISSKEIIQAFSNHLNIHYFYKENSGPGNSRNYGMHYASGDYFIILDSDCLLPSDYLTQVDVFLKENYVDCFGGADTATDDFSNIQKAINYAMTSFLTTGGIRGNKYSLTRFEPRSFNMGISKKAFLKSGGYRHIHPGEDPDLTIRLWELGFKTAFIPQAFVYHKRRISWRKFQKQITNFGRTRPILNHWHNNYQKFIHWLPTFFVLTATLSFVGLFFGYFLGAILFGIYFFLIGIDSTIRYRSLKIGVLSVWAVCLQFFCYGLGFLSSVLKLKFNKDTKIEILFPDLFFKSNYETMD